MHFKDNHVDTCIEKHPFFTVTQVQTSCSGILGKERVEEIFGHLSEPTVLWRTSESAGDLSVDHLKVG